MNRKFVKKIAAKPAAIAAPVIKPKTFGSSTKKKFSARELVEEHGQSSITTPFTLKADGQLKDYDTIDQPDPDHEPPVKKIVDMKVTFLTAQEITDMATVTISSIKMSGKGSIYDSNFGVISNYEKCPVCGMDWKTCPGHPGVIELPFSIPHPIQLKEISLYLTCVCEYCHRLVITWKQMKVFGILKYREQNRFKAYLHLAKKTIRCKSCKKPHGKYTVVDDKFFKCYKNKGEISKIPISYDEVVKIITNIREEEFKLLGFPDPLSHPKHLIISRLVVIPVSARPFVESNNVVCHDDLSHKYIEIQKLVEKFHNVTKEKEKLDLMDSLMFHIKTAWDNSKGKAKDARGKRVIKAIKQRISGKGGLIRQNIQGKRTVSCGRSVISPDPNLHVNEVGVPRAMAEKLTYPEPVHLFNMAYCQKLLDDNQVIRILRGESAIDAKRALQTSGFKLMREDVVIRDGKKINPGANFKIESGDEVLRVERVQREDGSFEIKKKLIQGVEPSKRKVFRLQVGDIIERKLRDSDQVIFNRQPSLHELSIRAKRVKIHDGNTLRMSLACTDGFNADFDGDL